LVEVLQYFKVVEIIGLENSEFARTVIGTNFSWIDILAYTLGIGFTLLVERLFSGKEQLKSSKSI
jgi:hypothetical protein